MIDWMRLSPAVRIGLVVFFVSTAAGFYFATQLHLAYPPSVRQPWGKALTLNLTHYWIWGALVPVVVFLGRRYRFESRGWRAIPIHLAASVVLTAIQLAAGVLVLALAFRDPLFLRSLPRFLQFNFHSSLPTYFLILFVAYAFDYAGRAERLEASLNAARLDALKTQLNPHFLFNTLNSISSLMYTDTDAADRMMARLSDLLRSTLQNDGAQEVTLREELEFVDRYIQIERIRFEERLEVAFLAGSDALDGLVPAFSLQPLVENAVRHGIGPRQRGGSIEIEARKSEDRLVVCVRDDGVGPKPGRVAEGIGLANTRLRLRELYGESASLEAGSGDGAGFTVRLDLPYRTPGREGV